jgi:hypothetical protein
MSFWQHGNEPSSFTEGGEFLISPVNEFRILKSHSSRAFKAGHTLSVPSSSDLQGLELTFVEETQSEEHYGPTVAIGLNLN